MWKRTNKPLRAYKRRRASVLVIVVAVLAMIALIGTAYISTARLDRYSAQNSVIAAEKESAREQYLAQAEKLVEDAIASDFDNLVTGPRSVSWLADRLPQKMYPANIESRIPIWRFISGKLDPDIPNADFEPPLVPPKNYPALDQFLSYFGNGDSAGRLPVRPNWITLNYPNDYPVEKYRGKARTYPAVSFFNPGLADLNSTNPLSPTYKVAPGQIPNEDKPFLYLGADADGDGIADSVLCRLSTGPVQGVTYYYAVRIIDNASAININTARTRGDAEYDNTASNTEFDSIDTNFGLRTFFPSSIGLRELFHVHKNVTAVNKPDPGRALWAIDEYRFGYDRLATQSIAVPSTPAPVNVEKHVPIPSTIADTINLSNVISFQTLNSDYRFATRGEALSMQLARRMDNPGYRATNRNDRFRAFDESNAAALAYRGGLARIDPQGTDIYGTLSTFEETVFDSVRYPKNVNSMDPVVRSAPNYVDDLSNTFKFFPANAVDDWFSWLNFDADYTKSMTFMPNVAFTQDYTNVNRFRPVRPLLTAYNPITNLIPLKTNRFRWPNVNYVNQRMPDILYPGMAMTDPDLPVSSSSIKVGGFIQRTKNGRNLDFMYMGRLPVPALNDLGSNYTANPFSEDLMAPKSWERQPYVSGRAKTSINTAGFPELWRAFFLTMCDPLYPGRTDAAYTDRTPFETEYAASGYASEHSDPFWGMHLSSASSTNDHDQNHLRMFRSSSRHPSATYMLHRYQMMVLRSALAAVNAISLRDRVASGSNKVPTRDITLYKVTTSTNPNIVPTASLSGAYEVSVFGMMPQPFITEVYANNDRQSYSGVGGTYQNPNGYVAIELY
ncbi:MAG TPA: hypothetical protein VHP11_01195, partial [Tepidisphaeraceae bacterium]|nr:hypothetical protein [Tepidisphaeraceae bacterium]